MLVGPKFVLAFRLILGATSLAVHRKVVFLGKFHRNSAYHQKMSPMDVQCCGKCPRGPMAVGFDNNCADCGSALDIDSEYGYSHKAKHRVGRYCYRSCVVLLVICPFYFQVCPFQMNSKYHSTKLIAV